MGDGSSRDVEDDSWTDLENVQADLVEVTPVRHGMVLGGRYAVERIIGRGGAGVVVRAHDRDLREVVAIKIVRAELAGQRVWAERLAREVKLARQIHHPHVCRVFDFQQGDGRVFLVMELAENGTLRDEIRSGALAARPLAARIADARAVASALDAIHKAGIVHRDLSPQNLLRMGDGRLVLSDFGLATDVSESTSSVHGGTVAYMAPEVVRGGKSSIASDVWALGVVMHEIVFAAKPRWSEAATPEMLAPALGRALTKEERAVLETCRACTVREPARRIESAREAGRRLTEPGAWWRPRFGASRRPLIFAGVLTLLAAGAVGLLRVRQGPAAAAPESPLIVPTGQPADWTDISTVLAEVPDRIQCTRLLPDQRTIRFVWGTPPRAEDIDTVTRKRVPSPIVPAAYAEGCPDLSPDGTRLVFQGHAADGRAFAFLSQRPDGKDAVPVVQTAEPSMSSEPTWLADQTFSYDIDAKHAGVFSVAAGHMYVLPEANLPSFLSMFRFVIDNEVFIARIFKNDVTEFVGISIPELKEDARFRIAEPALDLTFDGSRYYCSTRTNGVGGFLVQVDLARGRADHIGRIRDQFVRYPKFVAAGLAFVSVALGSDIFLRQERGELVRLTRNEHISFAARCGRDVIVSKYTDSQSVIERTDAKGRRLERLSAGPWDSTAGCSPDGRVWYYSHFGSVPSIKRCDDSGCRDLVMGAVSYPSVSPNGSQIAFLEFEKRGPIVKWIGAGGGKIHEVSETETGCAAGWASSKTLWISRRRDRGFVWTEVDVDSRRETGRTHLGSRGCSDGRSDPDSPVDPELRVVYDQTSQLRLLGREHLTRR